MKRLLAILVVMVLSATQGAFAGDRNGQFFAQADIDNSTSLTKAEFKSFINLLARSGNKNAKYVRTLRLYNVAWKKVNADANSVVTRQELRVAKATARS